MPVEESSPALIRGSCAQEAREALFEHVRASADALARDIADDAIEDARGVANRLVQAICALDDLGWKRPSGPAGRFVV